MTFVVCSVLYTMIDFGWEFGVCMCLHWFVISAIFLCKLSILLKCCCGLGFNRSSGTGIEVFVVVESEYLIEYLVAF